MLSEDVDDLQLSFLYDDIQGVWVQTIRSIFNTVVHQQTVGEFGPELE